MPTTKFTPVSKRSSCVQSYLCQSGFLTNSFLLCLTRQETLLLICKQHAAVRSAHELAIAIQLPLAPATAEIKREATQAGVCLQQPLGSKDEGGVSIDRTIDRLFLTSSEFAISRYRHEIIGSQFRSIQTLKLRLKPWS